MMALFHFAEIGQDEKGVYIIRHTGIMALIKGAKYYITEWFRKEE